jgi:hypothetical protein
MQDIWASKSLNLVAHGKYVWFGKVTKFLLLTLLTILYLLIYFMPLSMMQEIKSLQDVKSILPIPDEVARKFIRDKGLKNIALSGGGILGAESGSSSSRGLGNLNELLSKDSAAAAAAVPAVAGDEAVEKTPSLAANSASGHRRRHKEGGHHDKNDNHRAKGLQRILDLFGIKSLDQITSVVPIENIKEVPAASASALLSGGGGAANAVVPKTAADEAGGSTVAAADPLAPIQESLARENKASDMLSAALKQHGEKIKAIERVKRLHDVRRAEAIKRLEEVKQLLEVRQRKYKNKEDNLKTVCVLKVAQLIQVHCYTVLRSSPCP